MVREPQKEAGPKEERWTFSLLWRRGKFQLSVCDPGWPWTLLGSTMPTRCKSRFLKNQEYVWEVRVGEMDTCCLYWVSCVTVLLWAWMCDIPVMLTGICSLMTCAIPASVIGTFKEISKTHFFDESVFYITGNCPYGWCWCSWNIIFLESVRFLSLFSSSSGD